MKNKSGELQYELLEEIKFKLYSFILFSVYCSKLIIPSLGKYINKPKLYNFGFITCVISGEDSSSINSFSFNSILISISNDFPFDI